MSEPVHATSFSHRLRRMTGRDPDEAHRAATPLELLFDLTFVVCIGVASGQLSHLLAEGHVAAGLGAFAFAMFAISWAWINFSWFASAFDTDDWFYRVTTMVQMIGVVVLALGIPEVFQSIDEGETLSNGILVLGYVIMRVAMIAQWSRVAYQDPVHRRAALIYIATISVAQVGWVVLALMHLDLPTTVVFAFVLYVIELGGPYVAERRTNGTPWHAHHIAERFALFTIITLGEGVFGTIASVSAITQEQGFSMEAIVVVFAGVGLTFGLWWTYFIMPSGEILARFRARGFVWGYGHIVIFAAIAATGAGLHVAAYVTEGVATIGVVGATLTVAIPVFVFSVMLFALYGYLVQGFDPFHLLLFIGSTALLGAAVVAAMAGASLSWCLVLITLSPFVVVIGYETIGHRHKAEMLARALG